MIHTLAFILHSLSRSVAILRALERLSRGLRWCADWLHRFVAIRWTLRALPSASKGGAYITPPPGHPPVEQLESISGPIALVFWLARASGSPMLDHAERGGFVEVTKRDEILPMDLMVADWLLTLPHVASRPGTQIIPYTHALGSRLFLFEDGEPMAIYRHQDSTFPPRPGQESNEGPGSEPDPSVPPPALS